jgi:G3E family GTPase
VYGDVPLELMLGLGESALDDSGGDVDEAGVPHGGAALATWAWTSSRPLEYASVRAVLGSLPPFVYRAKGFLNLVEARDQRVVAHVVGTRVDVRPSGPWNGAEPRTELVFISLAPDFDVGALRERLAATVAANGAAS